MDCKHRHQVSRPIGGGMYVNYTHCDLNEECVPKGYCEKCSHRSGR
jgi:hypothetical protein